MCVIQVDVRNKALVIPLVVLSFFLLCQVLNSKTFVKSFIQGIYQISMEVR